jgi:hypothetical protein
LSQAQDKTSAKALYESACVACHGAGILNAPKFGDSGAWSARAKVGLDALVKSAIAGTAKGMPPGWARRPQRRADPLGDRVHDGRRRRTGKAAAPRRHRPPRRPHPHPVATLAPPPASAPRAHGAAAVPATTRTAPHRAAEVNAFNRLLKPLGRFNRPAVESGIHDPANDMTLQLQPPAVAFATLPKSLAGNHVDWVKALDAEGHHATLGPQRPGAPPW